mgnify:CR=1 FL=1
MTIAEYEKLYNECMKIADELERCRACIQDVEWEFSGNHPNCGAREGCMGLHMMNAVLVQYRNYGFWQGESAQAFADKLQEIYNEFTGAKDDILAGLRGIEKNLENQFNRKRDKVSAAYNELGDLQKGAKAFVDIF